MPGIESPEAVAGDGRKLAGAIWFRASGVSGGILAVLFDPGFGLFSVSAKPGFLLSVLLTVVIVLHEFGHMPYSKLIHALSQANIRVDRKILSDLAISDPAGFKAIAATGRHSDAGISSGVLHSLIVASARFGGHCHF